MRNIAYWVTSDTVWLLQTLADNVVQLHNFAFNVIHTTISHGFLEIKSILVLANAE
jgi:hypothetical protein